MNIINSEKTVEIWRLNENSKNSGKYGQNPGKIREKYGKNPETG